MTDILTSLQLFNGLALLVLIAMVSWLLLRRPKDAVAAETFLQELAATADAIIERYEQERVRLDKVASRAEAAIAHLNASGALLQAIAAHVGASVDAQPAEPGVTEEPAMVGANGKHPIQPECMTLAEIEFLKKMQRMRGGESR